MKNMEVNIIPEPTKEPIEEVSTFQRMSCSEAREKIASKYVSCDFGGMSCG